MQAPWYWSFCFLQYSWWSREGAAFCGTAAPCEFLQTYILSLAVHFHPHEAAFLLIDYKGGGMAQVIDVIDAILIEQPLPFF
jgi:hypothetical protein